MELQPGAVVGRYRLERLLGQGGMGTVWEAVHLDTAERAALKVVRDDQASDPVRHRRLLREARAASAVLHPNVVRIREVLEAADGSPIIVMDLLVGETLADRLARDGTLSLKETAVIMGPVVSAVATAHAAGVIHRDLKPDNIFLADDGGEVVPTVLDFGIAKVHVVSAESVASGALTATGAVLGTPHYMAPEQLFGEHDVDHRTDVWALGVILYECLTGMRPLGGGSLGQVLKAMLGGAIAPVRDHAPWLPEAVAQAIDRMLTRDRKERPDLLRVHDILADYGGSLSATLRAARPVEPASERAPGYDETHSDDRFRSPRRFTGVVPPLPRAPGESRFNIKGIAYRGFLRFVSERLPGGMDAFCGALEDVRLHPFVRQPFIAAARYDILPFFPMFAAAARVMGMPFEQFVRFATTSQAEYDARTVFKTIYEGARPDDLAARITEHGTWYYDFGRTVGTNTEPNVVSLTYFGQPAYLEPWFALMHVAYTEETLRILGASDIVGSTSHVAAGGSRQGLSLIDVRSTVRWRMR